MTKQFRQTNACLALCITGGWTTFTIAGIAITSQLGFGMLFGMAGIIGGFFVAQWIAD